MKKYFSLIILLVFMGMIQSSIAEVRVDEAWVRATVPGQPVGAAYMVLMSPQPVTMVYAETDRAGSVEMHSMALNNGVMRMRSLEELELPAGAKVTLAPGGLHLMLFKLKSRLQAGEQVRFRLCFKDKDGKIQEQFVIMPVKVVP